MLTEDERVCAALAFIRDHLAEGINVESLLADLGVSRTSLETRMKRATGQTPLQAISHARVEQVKKLLIRTDHAIEHISRA